MPDQENNPCVAPSSFNETIERDTHVECEQCSKQTVLALALTIALVLSNGIWATLNYNTVDRLESKAPTPVQITRTVVVKEACDKENRCTLSEQIYQ